MENYMRFLKKKQEGKTTGSQQKRKMKIFEKSD
jgi:hypothetical protein